MSTDAQKLTLKTQPVPEAYKITLTNAQRDAIKAELEPIFAAGRPPISIAADLPPDERQLLDELQAVVGAIYHKHVPEWKQMHLDFKNGELPMLIYENLPTTELLPHTPEQSKFSVTAVRELDIPQYEILNELAKADGMGLQAAMSNSLISAFSEDYEYPNPLHVDAESPVTFLGGNRRAPGQTESAQEGETVFFTIDGLLQHPDIAPYRDVLTQPRFMIHGHFIKNDFPMDKYSTASGDTLTVPNKFIQEVISERPISFLAISENGHYRFNEEFLETERISYTDIEAQPRDTEAAEALATLNGVIKRLSLRMSNCDIDEAKHSSMTIIPGGREYAHEKLPDALKQELMDKEAVDSYVPIYACNIGPGMGTAHTRHILHGRSGFYQPEEQSPEATKASARWLQSTFIKSDVPATSYSPEEIRSLMETLPGKINTMRAAKGLESGVQQDEAYVAELCALEKDSYGKDQRTMLEGVAAFLKDQGAVLGDADKTPTRPNDRGPTGKNSDQLQP